MDVIGIDRVIGIIGILIGAYGIFDSRRARNKKDQAIEELRSLASSTHSFLVALKPSISSTPQINAINDQLAKTSNALKKAENFSK